jgi:hypothetical protein
MSIDDCVYLEDSEYTYFNIMVDIPDTDLRDDDIKQIVSKA